MAAVFATADGYYFDLTTVDVSEGGTQFDFSLGLLEETTLTWGAGNDVKWGSRFFC